MDLISDTQELPFTHQSFGEEANQLNFNKKDMLFSFNQGQAHLAKELHYTIEEILVSIKNNDGSFEDLLFDLKEDIQDLLKKTSSFLNYDDHVRP